MKYSFAVLAAAASVTQVTATWGGWHNAPHFPVPDNCPNKCLDKQKEGWNWKDLPDGDVKEYDGFDFKGWTCEKDFSKRDLLAPRTFGGRVIRGACGPQKETAPSFECGKTRQYKDFSVKKFDITVEFDCRMEFHYDMPDGSTCKHSQECKAGGTTVHNTQCGGAKKVHFIYPEQPNKPKKCNVGVHHIDFDCEDKYKPPHNPPKPPQNPPKPPHENPPKPPHNPPSHENPPKPPHNPPTPPSPSGPVSETTSGSEPGKTTSAPPAEETTPVETTSVPVESTVSSEVPVETPSGPVETPSAPGVTSSAETTSAPAESTVSSEVPVESTSVPVETTSAPVETPSAPVSTPVESVPVESTVSSEVPVETTSAPVESSASSTVVTTYDTTSTIFTTSVQTITSCGPEVPDCPNKGSTAVVTVTIPVSTTICPVTETITHPGKPTGEPSKPVEEPSKPSAPVEEPSKPAEQPTTSTEEGSKPSAPVESEPEEPLPCPDVVPKCLNTFLYLVEQCKDNSDSKCYCPSKPFVDEIFKCLYAHGESDDIIAEAVSFFQGICAPFIPQNPGIATGADEVTQIITVTGTPTVTSLPYTTVVVIETITEPAVSEGTTIEGSSTVKTISTEVTVPQVTLPPAPAANPTNEVPETGVPAQPTGPAAPGNPSVPTFITSRPNIPGTGVLPTPVGPTQTPPIGAASGVRASFGAGLAVMVAAMMLM
jgi:hypothetical protein